MCSNNEPNGKPKKKHLIETVSGEYWADDFLIRSNCLDCIRVDTESNAVDNFLIYEAVTVIHDYEPKLSSLKAFKRMKRKEIKAAHHNFKLAEELAKKNLNYSSLQPSVDVQ